MAFSDNLKPLLIGFSVIDKEYIEMLSNTFSVSQAEIVRLFVQYMRTHPLIERDALHDLYLEV